jgi:hypothetical protein
MCLSHMDPDQGEGDLEFLAEMVLVVGFHL